MGEPDPRSRSTVWIAEEDEPNMMLTGRFSGYLDRGNRLAEEIEDLSADEAIAWGRERAAVVLIRTGDSDYHSAGERNPDPDELAPWPPSGLRLERRRVPGFEALDNTEEDPPVLWDVRVAAGFSAKVDPRPFHDVIRASPGLRNVQGPAPGYPPASAAFLVKAATRAQAHEIAETVVDAAFKAMRDPVSEREDLVFTDVEVYPHRPGESVTGPGIFH